MGLKYRVSIVHASTWLRDKCYKSKKTAREPTRGEAFKLESCNVLCLKYKIGAKFTVCIMQQWGLRISGVKKRGT